MRENKFRAYYERSRKYLECQICNKNDPIIWSALYGICRHVIYSPVSPPILEFFVGKEDKNGKKIFEGDIFNCIYHSDGCVNHVFVVSYSSEATRFYLSKRGDHCQQPAVRQIIGDVARYCSIGNIHQNLELLKGEL